MAKLCRQAESELYMAVHRNKHVWRRTQPRSRSRNVANKAGTVVLPVSRTGSPTPSGSLLCSQAITSMMLAARTLSVRCLRFSTATTHSICWSGRYHVNTTV